MSTENIETAVADAEEATPDVDAILEELAALDDVTYAQRRKAEADKLGVPVGFLDSAIKKHRASNGGTASFSCSRYHASARACLFSSSVPGRTRRNIRLCFSSIEGGWSRSQTVSK